MSNPKITTKTVLLSAAVLVIALIFYYNSFLSPNLKRFNILSRVIPEKEQQLKEMEKMREQYLSFRAKHKDSDQPLIELLEEIAQRLNLKENLKSVEPTEMSTNTRSQEINIKLKFHYISFEELVAYLNEVEKLSKAIQISNLEINTTTENEESSLLATIELTESMLDI